MSKILSCVVVDDDELSLKVVEALIEKTDSLALKGLFQQPSEAVSAVTDDSVDILFLDIEMPEMTGLELLNALNNHPYVILISTKTEYALEAYKYDVVDYLVKPLDYSRFLQAIEKVKKRIKEKASSSTEKKQENVYIKVDSMLVNFNLKDILYIEAYGDYIKIHTPGKVHVVYSTMKKIEEKLPSDEFIRIHRSYIARLDRIKNIDLNSVQVEQKVIPVSNSYKESLLSRVKTF
ncbi:MAG: LytR/AlgR family response regulator transcription factor [Cyclobacteriaceae bacterium]